MNNRKKINLTWFLIFLSCCILLEKKVHSKIRYGTIEGRVVNHQSDKPIPNANITIEGTLLGAAADEDGYFIIERIQPGSYHLICSAIGFRKETRVIHIKSNQSTQVTFRLQETAIKMNDLVVTASKYHQSIDNTPVRIDLIDQKDLRIRNATTLDQALRYVPGVQTAGNNISIRGSSGFSFGLGTRTLVLLDGVPFLSGDEGKANLGAIPVSEIQQVEVLKGAGSAMYGSSAMAGVINIITQDPQADSAKAGISFYTGFYSDPSYERWKWYHSQRTFQGATVHYENSLFGIASNLSVQYRQDEHFKQDADFRYLNVYGKFRFRLNPDNHWRIETGLLNKEIGGFLFWKDINHALIPGNEPENSFTRTHSDIFYLHSIMTQTLSSKLFYRLRFNYKRNEAKDVAEPRPGETPELVGTYRGSEAETYGHELQFTYQYSAQHNFVFGWEFNGNNVESIHYGDRQLFTGSLYSQFSWQCLQNLKAEIGGRWDIEGSDEIPTSSQFNPKVGLNYHPSQSSHLRFSAGRGFRAPSIAERFISTFANQIRVLPNPDVMPERNISAEIGVTQDITSFTRTDLTYFFTDYWDLIEPQLQSQQLAVRFENITRARIHGIEFSQNFHLFRNHLQLKASYTYINTKDLSKMINGKENPNYGNELKYRPEHLLYLRASYNWHDWTVGTDFRYISKINRVDRLTNVPDITTQVPAYVTDVQIGLKKPNYAIMFIVNNLFQYYYLISPGNMGKLRHFTVRFSWNYR